LRHLLGYKKGITPSKTNISAKADNTTCQVKLMPLMVIDRDNHRAQKNRVNIHSVFAILTLFRARV